MLGQVMLDTDEDIVRGRTIWGRVVIYSFETIFQIQIRAGRPAKLKCFAKRVVSPVLKHSDRRVVVLNARERVTCHGAESREPVIGKRKGIGRVEVIGAHILRANIGFEIRLRLVSGGNAWCRRKAVSRKYA